MNLVLGTRLLVLLVTLVPGGCYTGAARTVSPADLARDPGWLIVRGVPFVEQRAENDCGAAALAMVLRYWGLPVGQTAMTPAHPQRGLRAGELRDFARGRGMEAFVVQGQLPDLWAEMRAGSARSSWAWVSRTATSASPTTRWWWGCTGRNVGS